MRHVSTATARPVIRDGRLYPDLKMGTLTLGSSGVGTQIVQHLEVNWASDGSAEIVLFAKLNRNEHLRRFAKWAQGNPSCSI
ncbi:MAG: hypothetical protein I8H71_00845 [Xanthomonadaceae bacterium]|nr:hypothetical protein [Xanthomonadaceae bacterium]